MTRIREVTRTWQSGGSNSVVFVIQRVMFLASHKYTDILALPSVDKIVY